MATPPLATEVVSLHLGFVTLFPEVVRAGLAHGVVGRAIERGLVRIETQNPREYTYDRHRTVDDRPFGGAPGMLLRPEPVATALRMIPGWESAILVAPDPAGPRFQQSMAADWATHGAIIFLCGHYEGIDDRVHVRFGVRRVSLGDFVLSNGEIPAVLMADAVARLHPGVLGSAASLGSDSLSAERSGLLSPPTYTRPPEWEGIPVPDVLRQGNHAEIERWERRASLHRTRAVRPDLLVRARLEPDDAAILASDPPDMPY